jgi:uncharacterized membrane protein
VRLLELFGRLHPLLVHLPIGLLVGCVALELAARRLRANPALVGVLTWIAALSAVVTAASGLVLSREGGYSSATLENHERLGLSIAATSLLAAVLFRVHRKRASRAAELGYRAFLVVAVLLLVPAGHLGSTLTRGSDWLLAPFRSDEAAPAGPVDAPPPAAPPGAEGPSLAARPGIEEPREEPVPAAAPEAPDYARAIAPIFAANCASCHGAAKHKGGLRLDSHAAILRGGDGGPVVVPGDPAASELVRRVRLPLADEDHMPPEGKAQPAAAELALVEAWIRGGAPASASETGSPAETSALESEAKREEPTTAPDSSVPPPAEPAPPAAEALDAVRSAFVHAEPLGEGSSLLWIDFAAAAPSIDDARAAALLEPLAANVAELGLARARIGDATLALLARLPRLERLDLRATPLTDAGLARLAGHARLRELVLAQTGVTDAAVDVVLALPALERVSLWSTGLSPEGLARLRAARPALVVEAGDALAAAALEEEPPVVLADPPQPGPETPDDGASASSGAGPVNAVCPVSGKPIDARYVIVHEGREVAFCCPRCPSQFWADPSAHPVAPR